MSDIRLEHLDFALDGKIYQLRVNMNVLADVQADFGGRLDTALNGTSDVRSVLSFLAAMLNDYAEEKGWPERFTSRSLGRRFGWDGWKQLPTAEIMSLVTRAILPGGTESVSEPDTQESDDSKN